MEVEAEAIEGNQVKERAISSLPDFAQIFAFLQLFGNTLHLLPVTLKDLEDFFAYGHNNESTESSMVHNHWRLVRNVSKSEGLKEWQRMAVKFARKRGLIRENVPYSELDVETRVKILRLACEDQFEFNVSFRKELKELERMETPCIGVDSDGHRHWLMKDSNHDIRLYSESNYDEEPPAEAQWTELARSLSGLGRYVSTLETRRKTSKEEMADSLPEIDSGRSLEAEPKLNGVLEDEKNSDSLLATHQMTTQSGDNADQDRVEKGNSIARTFSSSSNSLSIGGQAVTAKMEIENGEKTLSESLMGGERGSECNTMEMSSKRPKRKASTSPTSKTSRQMQSKWKSSCEGRRRKSPQPKAASPPQDEGGCLKCHKDIDYELMLLCDECDKECHTYCQYPRLWSIPKGNWICPLCSEGHLIDALKAVYLQLSAARERHEKEQERKQKSVARLQKSGLLVQNIIEDADDGGRRSRRSRKDINYAELNDVYLPPLGPRDTVGNQTITAIPSTRSRTRRNDVYIQDDYLAPRVRSTSSRRRWRHVEDDEEENGEREDELITQKESKSVSHSLDDHHGSSLDVIAEEDENESKSTTPNSALSESPPPGGLHQVEVVKKKPRFAYLENNVDEDSDDDLSPVDTLVHQTLTPPRALHHLNVPPVFHAPPHPAPPSHNHYAFIPPQASSLHSHVQTSPLLPLPPFRTPTTHFNRHDPSHQALPLKQQAAPVSLPSSLPLPFSGVVATSKPYTLDQRNPYFKLPTDLNPPETMLSDEGANE